ncbi:MAG: hypothetical protein QGH45_14955 [Myxococcota bacterium]|jgi:hypothetical protein|nr:hypothetical protein [Myxococcota bacterium]
MTAESDAKVTALLDKITEETTRKREDRREDKWPEYRETESASRRKEILVNHYRLAAIRWAKVWLPATADIELRQVEKLMELFIERDGGGEGDEEVQHRRIVQGLVNLGNTLSRMLRNIQGSNAAARLAAIEHVRAAIESGEGPATIFERAEEYRPQVLQDEGIPVDVRD